MAELRRLNDGCSDDWCCCQVLFRSSVVDRLTQLANNTECVVTRLVRL